MRVVSPRSRRSSTLQPILSQSFPISYPSCRGIHFACRYVLPFRNTFGKYVSSPPFSTTLRYMGKNSVRLNWSNARKLTTSSGKKIPRFFAEKKKEIVSFESNPMCLVTIQAIFSILRHIEYDSTLGFVFLLTPVCPILSLSEIYRHVIAFHPVGSNSNRRFNVSIQ